MWFVLLASIALAAQVTPFPRLCCNPREFCADQETQPKSPGWTFLSGRLSWRPHRLTKQTAWPQPPAPVQGLPNPNNRTEFVAMEKPSGQVWGIAGFQIWETDDAMTKGFSLTTSDGPKNFHATREHLLRIGQELVKAAESMQRLS